MLKRIETLIKEPSSWAGFAAGLAGLGLFGITPETWDAIMAAIVAVSGAVAMVVRDRADLD